MTRRVFELLLGLIALLTGILGAWYGRSIYLRTVSLVSLPVPKTDLPPYTLLSAEMFQFAQFPRALVENQSGYALSLPELSGRLSTGTLLGGLPVPKRQAVPPAEFRLADPQLEVISLPVSPENIVGGQVRMGEQVNLYRTNAWTEKSFEEDSLAPVEIGQVEWIACVRVVAVLAKDGTQASEEGDSGREVRKPPVQILVLAASPETVSEILEAQALTRLGNNQLWVTLAEVPLSR
jgi:hypothetical protein